MRNKNPGWQIMVVEGSPIRGWRSASHEAKQLALVVPIRIAERWRVIRQDMTVGLRKRVKEDRN